MKVYFLAVTPPEKTGAAEMAAALEAARSIPGVEVEAIRLSRLPTLNVVRGDVLWWHWPAAELPEEAMSREMADILEGLARRGAGVLLTLGAALLPGSCGLGGELPETEAGEWAGETGAYAYRGFFAFDRHPLFNCRHGFGNVVSTWTPAEGEPYWRARFAERRPAGAIAVGSRYISMLDGTADIWEHQLGAGVVLCVGSFLYFNARTNHQADLLPPLLENMLFYAADEKLRGEAGPYWPTDLTPGCDAADKKMVASLPKLSLAAAELSFDRTGVPAIAANPGPQYYACAGRRALLSGRQGESVHEVWAYPTRIIKELRWTLSAPGGQPIAQSDIYRSGRVYPETAEFSYEGRGFRVEELLLASVDKPAVLQRLEVEAEKPCSLEVSFAADLALMWPMPMGSVGRLSYLYDAESAAVYVASEHKGCWLAVSFSEKPEGVEFADESPREAESLEERTYKYSQLRCKVRMPASAPGRKQLVITVAGGRNAPGFETVVTVDASDESARNAQAAREAEEGFFRLATPDAVLDEGVAWGQRKMGAFLMETPNLGTALVAGFTGSGEGWTVARPGYGWYFGRDSLWTSLALLTLGMWEAVEENLRFLARHQAPDGKVLHETSPSDYTHYDSADANPLYLIVADRYLSWSGREAPIKELLPSLRSALEFCFRWDRDGDGLTENTGVGHGWIEGGRLFGAHVTFYMAGLWLGALRGAARLFAGSGDKALLERVRATASRVEDAINTRFWDAERRTYYYGLLRDGSMSRSESIMPAPVIQFGETDPEKDREFLRRLLGPDVVADWGARMISELDESYNPVGYHYGSVWPLYSGWLGLALFRNGLVLQGYELLLAAMANHRHFSAGCFDEVLRGDYFGQAGVCPQQAWSDALVLMVATQGLLGLEALGGGALRIAPDLPPHWRQARADNIRWSGGSVSLSYRRRGLNLEYEISGLRGGERIVLDPLLPAGSQARSLKLDGKALQPESKPEFRRRRISLPLEGRRGSALLEIRLDRFLAPMPCLRTPEPGKMTVGYRIRDWGLEERELWVEVVGRSGVEDVLCLIDPADILAGSFLPVRREPERKIARFAFPRSDAPFSEHLLKFELKR